MQDKNNHSYKYQWIPLCANTHCCNQCYCPVCPLSRPTLNGIQVQLKSAANALVEDNCNVLFDTVINKPSHDVGYNHLTGEFILPTNRNYYIAWWVAVDGTDFTSMVEFATVVNKASIVTSSSPQVTCQLSGSTLVSVGAIPETLSLMNVSGNIIRYAPTSVQANIVIVETAL